MQRQRTIRPDLVTDGRLTSLPMGVRMLAVMLLLYADDEGRAEFRPRHMIRTLLGQEETPPSPERLEELMLMLDDSGFLCLYADEDGRTLFQIAPDLLGRVDRPRPSLVPPPERVPASWSLPGLRSVQPTSGAQSSMPSRTGVTCEETPLPRSGGRRRHRRLYGISKDAQFDFSQ